MIIEKVLNNNAVLSTDSDGKEVVVLGKGIAFKKSPKDAIDNELVTGIYELKGTKNELVQLASEIPYEYFELSQRLASEARKTLNSNLDERLELRLADHIYFAVDKLGKGIRTPNIMLGELMQYYPKEYEIGKKYIREINEKFGCDMDENEAGFIAFHLASSQGTNGTLDANALMNEIKKVIGAVEKYFNKQIDRDSQNYSRFIVHLKFFLTKVLSGDRREEVSLENDSLYQMLCEKYADILDCLKRINAILLLDYDYELTDSDKMYLIIHIARVIKDNL